MPGLVERTDHELLKAFVDVRDEAAFAEIVRRHGPLVWSVCRRVLGRAADAEDAVQAAFVAFAQRSARGEAIRAVAPWLHRVGHDIAVNHLKSRKARERREKEAAMMNLRAEGPAGLSDEQGALLHEEIHALPEKYRQAIVLCHLKGMSQEEAATTMACPQATLKTWAARGRERLRSRLARRGLVLSLAALTSLLSAEAGAAELPAAFVTSTAEAAARFVAGHAGVGSGGGALAPHVTAMAEGALKKMSYAKLQVVMVMVVLFLCVGAATGWLLNRATGAEGGGVGKDVAAGEKNPLAGVKEAGKKGVHKKPAVDEKALKAVVDGNSVFAVDLYGQLAKENPGKNLFFSPYSMSVALSMAAEGAREQTAEEMGTVLRFPEATRNSGADARMLPWNTTPIHSGMHALYQRFNPKPATPEMRAQIAAKENELKASQQKEQEFQKAKKWRERSKQRATSLKLTGELNALRAQVDQYELRVANALYGEKTYPFVPAFMTTINTFYGTGAAVPVDFIRNFEAVRRQINTDVADFTNQRIKDLLAEGSLDELTRLVLVNAIYFKGEWAIPFEERATKQEDFLAGPNQKVAVSMMHNYKMKGARYGAFNADGSLFKTPQRIDRSTKKETLYPGRDGFLMAELPYKGGDLCMVVLVPQDAGGLSALEKKLTTAHLHKWIGQLEKRESVNVQLPKFKLETDYQEMKETLKALGMVRAFGARAEFQGIGSAKDLYISKVAHKAFVEVNEKGTEAAAATAVVMRKISAPMNWPFTPTFRADKPFLFAIRDVKTGSILFMGRMMNPNS